MNQSRLRRPETALLGVLLGLWTAPTRAQAPKTIEIDLAKVKDECKTVHVPATQGRVKVVVRGTAYGDSRFWQFVHQRLHAFREQLELGVEKRKGVMEYELRYARSFELKRTLEHLHGARRVEALKDKRTPTKDLYDEAKRYIAFAGRGTEAFWKQILDTREYLRSRGPSAGESWEWAKTKELFPVREFDLKPEAGTFRTIHIEPCYRLEDLEHLMKLLVKASRKYVEVVDGIEKEIKKGQAALERARRSPDAK